MQPRTWLSWAQVGGRAVPDGSSDPGGRPCVAGVHQCAPEGTWMAETEESTTARTPVPRGRNAGARDRCRAHRGHLSRSGRNPGGGGERRESV
jgi:hypothetical protein